MSYKEKYSEWLQFNDDIKDELLAIEDEKELEDRFYKDLNFGTGGLRGVMGAGTNRMNSFTIKKASLGLGNYLNKKGVENPSVVIAYDTRNNSKKFAQDTASILTDLGIKSYIFQDPTPTPILSFAVRHLNSSAGVVITASHNPKEYNGFKVYNNEGGQLVPSEANEVIEEVNQVTDFSQLELYKGNKALLQWIGDDVINAYLEEATKQSFIDSGIQVTYTPLHGSGLEPVKRILTKHQVSLVDSQIDLNGDFPTVSSPNPEDPQALKKAIAEARENGSDLVLGTDPDCDRVGVAVKHNGEFDLLTGNQIGALLVDYVLQHSNITDKTTVIKTIVTNELGAEIARKKNLTVLETLTGFKFIGEKMNQFEKDKSGEFLIGYEESYGYLAGTHARDKDGVVSSLLICDMAAYYKSQGLTLIDKLDELYKEYGYYLDKLDSLTYQGKDGLEKIKSIMELARDYGEELLPNITNLKDYSVGIDNLPKSNVLKLNMENGTWIAIRPSGTEPKIKFYYSINSENRDEADLELKNIKEILEKKLKIELPKGV